MSVVFTGFRNNDAINQTLSYIVDLRNFLPEWLTFGFSAATGEASCATHTLYSWDFNSSLEFDNYIISPKGPKALSSKKWSTTRLVVEFSVGGFILVGGLAIILFALWKKNRRHKEDDHALDEEF